MDGGSLSWLKVTVRGQEHAFLIAEKAFGSSLGDKLLQASRSAVASCSANWPKASLCPEPVERQVPVKSGQPYVRLVRKNPRLRGGQPVWYGEIPEVDVGQEQRVHGYSMIQIAQSLM